MMKKASDTPRLQLKIVLDHLKPAIWRRMVVSEDITFLQLHRVIQEAMGWEDCHMHEFELSSPRIRIGTNSDSFGGFGDFGGGPHLLPERTTRLADVLGSKKKFRYWYDFGDDWWHTVSIEKRLPAEPTAPPAVLLAGQFACPPEDCGGPYGYAEMMATLADPSHPERGEILEWLGDFDPERFDFERHAKRVAATIKPRKGKAAKPAGR